MAHEYSSITYNPWDSDSVAPLRYRTSFYGGVDDQLLVDASPNYPPPRSGLTATLYFMEFPGIIDVSDPGGSYPIILRDATSATVLTPVSGVPGANEYRVALATSERRSVFEMNSAQAGHLIDYDFYIIGGALNGADFNNIAIQGDLSFKGELLNSNTTFNQGDADTEIISLNSSDVTHGMTSLTDTNTYGSLAKVSATEGGLNASGYSSGNNGLKISSVITNESSTVGPIILDSSKKSGTSKTAITDSSLILELNNNGTQKFNIKGDGRVDCSTGGVLFKISIANVSNPPTDAELDSIFGNPVLIGNFVGIVNDNGSNIDVWLCVSTGLNWFYENLTKAV
jgi:hypothetical protein